MDALRFVTPTPSNVRAPVRADVALFVGRAEARGRPLPDHVRAWFEERGWTSGGAPHPRSGREQEDLENLRDVPVPVESFAEFEDLFRTQRDPAEAFVVRGTQVDTGVVTWLAAAVRAFFAAGGRRAIVVATAAPTEYTGFGAAPGVEAAGDPADLRVRRDRVRARTLGELVPGLFGTPRSNPADVRTWRGLGHVFGLEEVSFACLPDLAELVSPEPVPDDDPADPPGLPERFVPCSTAHAPDPVESPAETQARAPRLDEDAFTLWAHGVAGATELIRDPRNSARGVQLVVGVPLALESSDTGTREVLRPFLPEATDETGPSSRPDLSSPFLQLVHPWLRTDLSLDQPEGLESPEGRLVGLLAGRARRKGTWLSAGNQHVHGVIESRPLLSPTDLAFSEAGEGATLRERVTLVHRAPGGWALASDVTTSTDERYRHASVNRLVSLLVRAVRSVGETSTFEPSGEALWTELRLKTQAVLDLFRADGALLGDPGYLVRCDRTTTTQADLDNGRVVVEVVFDAAVPIERLTIALNLSGAVRVA